MSNPEFECAVNFVVEQIKLCEILETMGSDGIDFDYLSAAMDTPSRRLLDGSFIIAHEDAYRLIIEAENTRGAFDYAAAICVKNIEANRRMPHPLHEFACSVLSGNYPIPPQSRRHRLWAKNFFLVSTIEDVTIKYGFNPSRNDEAKDQFSSIDAVKVGMERVGQHITFDTLKNLYMRKDSSSRHELAKFSRVVEKIGHQEFFLRLPGTDPSSPPWAGS
ncbi:hypothetical protein SAMN05444004_101555 [Jannaschia faecimaris]|uniref:Uncharacterized protein n=1 Tax=Jannaschia faecimaris TaxID=1244108 RepID=A0A1H3K8V6_9RHOB|nr:hypothetical protein [Jannaschia faecimaris]SDY48611.1 hypothetical protein SAMN05444004_101555 [Jannaschia faecimaris]